MPRRGSMYSSNGSPRSRSSRPRSPRSKNRRTRSKDSNAGGRRKSRATRVDSLDAFLESIGMEEYADVLHENDITLRRLKMMSQSKLMDLDISLLDASRIVKAVIKVKLPPRDRLPFQHDDNANPTRRRSRADTTVKSEADAENEQGDASATPEEEKASKPESKPQVATETSEAVLEVRQNLRLYTETRKGLLFELTDKSRAIQKEIASEYRKLLKSGVRMNPRPKTSLDGIRGMVGPLSLKQEGTHEELKYLIRWQLRLVATEKQALAKEILESSVDDKDLIRMYTLMTKAGFRMKKTHATKKPMIVDMATALEMSEPLSRDECVKLIRARLGIAGKYRDDVIIELSEEGRLSDDQVDDIYAYMLKLSVFDMTSGYERRDVIMSEIAKVVTNDSAAVENSTTWMPDSSLGVDASSPLEAKVAAMRMKLKIFTETRDGIVFELSEVDRISQKDLKREYKSMVKLNFGLDPKLKKHDNRIRAMAAKLATNVAKTEMEIRQLVRWFLALYAHQRADIVTELAVKGRARKKELKRLQTKMIAYGFEMTPNLSDKRVILREIAASVSVREPPTKEEIVHLVLSRLGVRPGNEQQLTTLLSQKDRISDDELRTVYKRMTYFLDFFWIDPRSEGMPREDMVAGMAQALSTSEMVSRPYDALTEIASDIHTPAQRSLGGKLMSARDFIVDSSSPSMRPRAATVSKASNLTSRSLKIAKPPSDTAARPSTPSASASAASDKPEKSESRSSTTSQQSQQSHGAASRKRSMTAASARQHLANRRPSAARRGAGGAAIIRAREEEADESSSDDERSDSDSDSESDSEYRSRAASHSDSDSDSDAAVRGRDSDSDSDSDDDARRRTISLSQDRRSSRSRAGSDSESGSESDADSDRRVSDSDSDHSDSDRSSASDHSDSDSDRSDSDASELDPDSPRARILAAAAARSKGPRGFGSSAGTPRAKNTQKAVVNGKSRIAAIRARMLEAKQKRKEVLTEAEPAMPRSKKSQGGNPKSSPKSRSSTKSKAERPADSEVHDDTDAEAESDEINPADVKRTQKDNGNVSESDVQSDKEQADVEVDTDVDAGESDAEAHVDEDFDIGADESDADFDIDVNEGDADFDIDVNESDADFDIDANESDADVEEEEEADVAPESEDESDEEAEPEPVAAPVVVKKQAVKQKSKKSRQKKPKAEVVAEASDPEVESEAESEAAEPAVVSPNSNRQKKLTSKVQNAVVSEEETSDVEDEDEVAASSPLAKEMSESAQIDAAQSARSHRSRRKAKNTEKAKALEVHAKEHDTEAGEPQNPESSSEVERVETPARVAVAQTTSPRRRRKRNKTKASMRQMEEVVQEEAPTSPIAAKVEVVAPEPLVLPQESAPIVAPPRRRRKKKHTAKSHEEHVAEAPKPSEPTALEVDSAPSRKTKSKRKHKKSKRHVAAREEPIVTRPVVSNNAPWASSSHRDSRQGEGASQGSGDRSINVIDHVFDAQGEESDGEVKDDDFADFADFFIKPERQHTAFDFGVEDEEDDTTASSSAPTLARQETETPFYDFGDGGDVDSPAEYEDSESDKEEEVVKPPASPYGLDFAPQLQPPRYGNGAMPFYALPNANSAPRHQPRYGNAMHFHAPNVAPHAQPRYGNAMPFHAPNVAHQAQPRYGNAMPFHAPNVNPAYNYSAAVAAATKPKKKENDILDSKRFTEDLLAALHK